MKTRLLLLLCFTATFVLQAPAQKQSIKATSESITQNAPLTITAVPSSSNNLPDSLIRINSKLESRIETLERNQTLDKDLDDKYYNSISNQFSAASYSLTIFGFLFGVAAILLGVYVTYVERKIIKISEENSTLLKQNEQIKNDIVEINRLIQEDISGLYLKLRKEETDHLIKRITDVPEDIINLAEMLLTRDLNKEHFEKLKEAY